MSKYLFRPGEVVRLKSGGPPMTVNAYKDEYGDVTCFWFDASDVKQAVFNQYALEPIPKEKASAGLESPESGPVSDPSPRS